MNRNSNKINKELKDVFTYDEGLRNLRADLKKADVYLREVGFTFYTNPEYDFYGVKRKREGLIENDNYERWIAIRLIRNISKDRNLENLTFICEPCTMSGGGYYMGLEEAKNVVKYWSKLIKVCEHLNELKLSAPRKAFVVCIQDIKDKERK